MAVISNFKNFLKESNTTPGAFLEALNCSTGNKFMLLGLDICNIENSGIVVSVRITRTSPAASYYLIKDAPIPVGSTIQVITSQKHVLDAGDILEFSSSVVTLLPTPLPAAHLIGSYMECTLPD